MGDNRCMQRVLTGAALGGAVGGAVGASYGTYEAFAYKVCVLLLLSLCFSPNYFCVDEALYCYINIDRPLLLQIPGMLKVRHIGRTTLGSAGLFSLFLGAGSLLHCGRRN